MIPSAIPGRFLAGYAQPAAEPYTSEPAATRATVQTAARLFVAKVLP